MDGVRVSVMIDNSVMVFKSAFSYIAVPNVTQVSPMSSIVE